MKPYKWFTEQFTKIILPKLPSDKDSDIPKTRKAAVLLEDIISYGQAYISIYNRNITKLHPGMTPKYLNSINQNLSRLSGIDPSNIVWHPTLLSLLVTFKEEPKLLDKYLNKLTKLAIAYFLTKLPKKVNLSITLF